MMKAGGLSAWAVLGGSLSLGAAALLAVFLNSTPASAARSADGVLAADSTAVISVEDGESAISVGARLREAGLIRSTLFWNILARLGGSPVKMGIYEVPLPASQLALRKILVDGRQKLVRVTVPEGATLRKTAAILENADVCTAADFLDAACDSAALAAYRVPAASMEGYLYPDTYLFEARYPAPLAVRKMADTFFSRLREIDADADSMPPRELFDRVTLASIVEREYRDEAEAALIAGVFRNRLETGMRLESCATVEYVLTEIQGKPHPERLLNRDLTVESPYNTYLAAGLPPGPYPPPARPRFGPPSSPKKAASCSSALRGTAPAGTTSPRPLTNTSRRASFW
jgi:UPF0755 protein